MEVPRVVCFVVAVVLAKDVSSYPLAQQSAAQVNQANNRGLLEELAGANQDSFAQYQQPFQQPYGNAMQQAFGPQPFGGQVAGVGGNPADGYSGGLLGAGAEAVNAQQSYQDPSAAFGAAGAVGAEPYQAGFGAPAGLYGNPFGNPADSFLGGAAQNPAEAYGMGANPYMRNGAAAAAQGAEAEQRNLPEKQGANAADPASAAQARSLDTAQAQENQAQAAAQPQN